MPDSITTMTWATPPDPTTARRSASGTIPSLRTRLMMSIVDRWLKDIELQENACKLVAIEKIWKNPVDCMYQRAAALVGDYDSMLREVKAIHSFTNVSFGIIAGKIARMRLPGIFFDNHLYVPKATVDQSSKIGYIHGYARIPRLSHESWCAMRIDGYMKAYQNGSDDADTDEKFGHYDDNLAELIEDELQPRPTTNQ